MQLFDPDPIVVLSSVKEILLVDWPNKSLPGNLILAGFTVFGYSPGKYTRVHVAADPANNDFKLNFESLEEQPKHVDMVCIYRPDEEIEEITHKHVLPMHAKIMWIQPPAHSSVASELARKYDLSLVQNIDLGDLASRFKRD
ncbi:MAG: hypothetical protein C5B59_15685 [Bacteroidetes bacterium]|nr:MAG: hypothetical protein C5B59_15685 [Bacteroidota bacterium]